MKCINQLKLKDMIKVTFRNYPTNYTSNHIETFNNLESALRESRERDMLTVRIEEVGVGWHMVMLTKDGAAYLGQDYCIARASAKSAPKNI